MAEYSQWWEAFAGGEFTDWTGGELAPGEDPEARTREFYTQIVGPSTGYQAGEDGQGFGEIFNEYLASFDIEAMEQAEEAFRMSIGDPYGAFATDPFRWERISRMSPEEAQAQLAGELYGEGGYLGGTAGAEYGTSTAVGKEAYTSGLSAEREALTYGGLTGSQSLLSGTSGSILRSGEGIMQAEDVLSEAYKKSKTLGAEFMEAGETIQMGLEENLNTALTAYIGLLSDEKSRWYDNIMSQVETASDTLGAEFGGDWQEWMETEAYQEMAEQWEEGETYWEQEGEAPQWEQDQAGCADDDANCLMQSCGFGSASFQAMCQCNNYGDCTNAWDLGLDTMQPCGIGELWIDGECQPYEDLDIEYDSFGQPCIEGVDECGVCGGDGSTCASGEGGDEGGDACGGCPPGEVCNSWSGNCYNPTPGQPEGSEDIAGTPGKFPGGTPTGGY